MAYRWRPKGLNRTVTGRIDMRERAIEKRLRLGIEGLGGLCLKFVSPGRRNVPDRLILLPGQKPFMVETKAPGKKASAAQEREHARLIALGMPVEVLNTPESVDGFLWWTQKWHKRSASTK
jgi:hypothetical protein